MSLTFRTIPEQSDIERIREIVESTKFFYDHEVEIAAELVAERFNGGNPQVITSYLQRWMELQSLIPVSVR